MAAAQPSASEELRTLLATPITPAPSSPAVAAAAPPTDPRQVAYAALQHLRDSGDPTFLFLRTLIELTSTHGGSTGPNEELAFHCVGGLRHVVLHRWEGYGPDFRNCVRDWVLALGLGLVRPDAAVALDGAQLLPRTVSNACLGCAASLWKRGWPIDGSNGSGNDGAAVENAEAQSHLVSMLRSAHPIYEPRWMQNYSDFQFTETLLNQPFSGDPSQPHIIHRATQAASFLSNLLGEVSGTSNKGGGGGGGYNQPLEFHRLVHATFESAGNGLDMTLKVAMTALGGSVRILTESSSQNDGGGGGVDPSTAELCSSVFALTTDVLSWEFGGSNRSMFTTGGDNVLTGGGAGPTVFRPPERWREYIVRPDFLGAVFAVYKAVRTQTQTTTTGTPLNHRVRQLLLMLSSVSGPVYESKEQRLAYASFLVDGCLEVLALLHEASVKGAAEEDWMEGETVDLCAMVNRLVANFRVEGLCQLPSFANLLGAVAAVGTDLLQKNQADLQAANGDFDMTEGTIEWRDEALGHLLDAAARMSDDPWLLSGGGEAAKAAETTLASSLAPLYGSYVTVRTGMARMEEYFLTANAADLDEVREEISATTMDEEMTSASSLGRLNVATSVASLAGLLQQCLPKLQSLFEASTGAGALAEVTPDAAALLEETRILIVCTTHLLTDDNAGETPTIPDAIVQACGPSRPDSAATTAAVADIVSSLMQLAEFQASKIATSPSDPCLSPLLGKTLLWFFHRWAPAYILPQSLEYAGSGQTPGGILGTWTSPDASSKAVTFCITLSLHYNCYWPQESQVQEAAASLLLSLAKRGASIRELITRAASFEQLAALHAVTASLRHNSTEPEIRAALTAAHATVPETMVRGYCRLPYGDRARILTALCIGSSEMGDKKSEAVLEGCLTAVQSSFSSFVHALSNKQVHASDMNAKEMACLCAEMFGGIARTSEMSEPERIPVFITPSLKPLSDLMVYYAEDLAICESLLRFFRDYAEQFIAMLTREQCLALFHASADLLKSYSARHCTSRVVKRSASTLEADAEEEQNYSDILCAIQLLIHLGTKDFIDICSTTSNNAVKSDQITDVIFFGLKQILPLMTQGLLQFPTLCVQYFSLVGFMMDTYPEKVCALPYDLFRSLLDSLLFGMSHNDTFVSKSSLRGIGGLAREHLKSHALSGHLAHHPDIFDTCSTRLMQEVIFQTIIWDRLEPAGMALLPLAAIDLSKFAAVVSAISNQFGSVEKQQRFQSAFQLLLKPEVLAKVASGGYEGRMNRLKFKKDFEEFVKDVHSFLLLK